MNPLLEQFLSEAREFLQGIGEKLMQLEQAPDDAGLMIELFRLVHTLKGNSGLFDFPEMTRVLHAGEDLMDAVRNGRVAYSQGLADQLLDAMDFVGLLCDEIESDGRIDASRAADSASLAGALRALIELHAVVDADDAAEDSQPAADVASPAAPTLAQLPLADIPEAVRLKAYLRAMDGDAVHWVAYTPLEECFFQGDDPFFTARQTPDILWGRIVPREPWPPLAELDAYRCVLEFQLLTAAPREELAEYYRYVPDQVSIVAVEPWFVVIPQGDPNGGPVYEDFVADALHHLEAGDLAALKQAALTMLQLSNPELWLSSALRWLLLLLDSVPDNRAALAQTHRVAAHLDAAGLGLACERIACGNRQRRRMRAPARRYIWRIRSSRCLKKTPLHSKPSSPPSVRFSCWTTIPPGNRGGSRLLRGCWSIAARPPVIRRHRARSKRLSSKPWPQAVAPRCWHGWLPAMVGSRQPQLRQARVTMRQLPRPPRPSLPLTRRRQAAPPPQWRTKLPNSPAVPKTPMPAPRASRSIRPRSTS